LSLNPISQKRKKSNIPKKKKKKKGKKTGRESVGRQHSPWGREQAPTDTSLDGHHAHPGDVVH
jgi:hypothetical protein